MSIRLIVNPTAGGGRGARVAERATRELGRLGLQPTVLWSRSPHDPAAMAREASRDACPLVVGVGGDGLISQIANELVGSETTLGVVPCGVGNDFARGLRLPLDVKQACAVIAAGSVSRVDVGVVNDRRFFSVALMGFAAQINRRANRVRQLRIAALYSAITVASVFLDAPLVFRLTIDGRERRSYSWMIAVGNTWSSGRGMALVPSAVADDGLLDACLVNGVGRLTLLCNAFPRVFRGTHVYHTGVDVVRFRQAAVDAEVPCELYADGERFGCLPALFRTVPKALRVLVAPGSVSRLS